MSIGVYILLDLLVKIIINPSPVSGVRMRSMRCAERIRVVEFWQASLLSFLPSRQSPSPLLCREPKERELRDACGGGYGDVMY